MALRETFNPLAGKIIRNMELDAKLAAYGQTGDTLVQKISEAAEAGRLAEIGTLLKEMQHSAYLTTQAVADMEKAVLACENEVFAQIALENSLTEASAAGDVYVKILPLVKVAAFAVDDKNLLNTFVKAAEECADYSSKAGDLQEMQSAIGEIVKKASAKFGL